MKEPTLTNQYESTIPAKAFGIGDAKRALKLLGISFGDSALLDDSGSEIRGNAAAPEGAAVGHVSCEFMESVTPAVLEAMRTSGATMAGAAT